MANQNIRRIKFGSNAVISIVLLLVALFALNFIADRSRLKMDMTKNKEWTVAPATESILKKLSSQVNVTVYATSEGTPPAWTEQRNQLRDLLTEYRSLSDGKVRFSFVDPSKDKSMERKAQENNIRRQLMAQESASELNAREGYLGFTVEHKGKTQSVGVISPNHPLEYQLTMAINKVAQVDIPKIALIAPMGNQYTGEPGQYSMIQQVFAQEGYDIAPMQATAMRSLIEEKAPAMVVMIEPDKLTEEQLFYLDQYVMKGGKLFVASSSFAPAQQDAMSQPMGPQPKASPVNPLIENFGVKIDENLVEDWGAGVEMMMRTQRGPVIMRYPLVFRVTDLNKETSGTDRLGVIAMGQASSLSLTDKAVTGTVTILAKSTPQSLTQEGTFRLDPQQFLKRPDLKDPKLKSYDLMAMIHGQLKSRYAGMAPEDLPIVTKDDGTTHIVDKASVVEHSPENALVYVAGTCVSFADETVQQSPVNALMLLNLVDMGTRSGEMISLRSKMGNPSRLRADITPAQKDRAQVLVVAAVPVLLIFIGIGAGAYDRARRRRLALKYNKSK